MLSDTITKSEYEQEDLPEWKKKLLDLKRELVRKEKGRKSDGDRDLEM